MSDPISHIADNVICPEHTRIGVVTTSTTDIITTLSVTAHLGALVLHGNYLTVMADGGDVTLFFRGEGSTSLVAAGSVTASATTGNTRGWKIKDGVPANFRLTRNASGVLRTKMYHVCTAAAKRLRFYVSSARSVDEENRG